MQKIMSPESLQILNEYNGYAQNLLLKTISGLTEEQLNLDSEKSHGSISKMLSHMKGTEAFYLSKCWGTEFIDPQLPELTTILDYWENLTNEYAEFLKNQTVESLQKNIHLEFGPEISYDFPVWQLILQVFNHSTIHRGELSILLTDLGHPLPDMDIIIQFGEQTGQYF